MGFNNVGLFTINAGDSYRLDGWSWSDGSDHGAQYFSAHPLSANARLVMSEQNMLFGADRRWYYGFRVTNEGPNPTGFTVQGGGLSNRWKAADEIAVSRGARIRSDTWSWPDGSDHGGQLFCAHPRTADSKLLSIEENKMLGADGRWYYGFGILDEGVELIGLSHLEGGGFSNGFNGVGLFSIQPGASYRLDGWSWTDGSDQGAQYLSAHPLNPDARLVMSEQNKTLGTDGRWYYGFRVTNEGPQTALFSAQGGGFS
jgi:uncharacterized protein YchJ